MLSGKQLSYQRKEGMNRRYVCMVSEAEVDLKRESELSEVCTISGIRARIHQACSGG